MLDRGWQRAHSSWGSTATSARPGIAVRLHLLRAAAKRGARYSPPCQRARRDGQPGVTGKQVQTLGLVASSRRSLFMTGPAGNGKTTIAMALHQAQQGEIWTPYAIEIDGQVIKVFDLHSHQPVQNSTIWADTTSAGSGSSGRSSLVPRIGDDHRDNGFNLQSNRTLLRSTVSDEIQRRHAGHRRLWPATGRSP